MGSKLMLAKTLLRQVSAIALLWFSGAASAMGLEVKVLTLNLHAYHPMGEQERLGESRDGNLRTIPSQMFYFRLDELARGNTRRLNYLAKDIERLSPDIIFFQEVNAGLPTTPRNCDIFYQLPSGDDAWGNT